MKTEIIKSLLNKFESCAHKTDQGIEFWLARDLQQLLGYTKWDNFLAVISKAKISCEVMEHKVLDHFADVGKMVKIGSESEREIDDIMLTRLACYFVAQNGDSRKEEIVFAKNYFAVQARKFEIIEKRIQEFERVRARHKLIETEKELSSVIYQQTKNDKNFGLIRSKGDKALFGYTTQEMKSRLKIPDNRALADFQPTILLKAKDFATEITIFNTKNKELKTEQAISEEHIINNRSVRKTLISRGIRPENLPIEEDIKKIERKIESENKKSLKKPDKLEK
ncbi:MAG: DNA-damage-inducible protein D [Candidatus Nomurabacteria bacterium GW2011_GWE1_32_28]|uniref:DNA-damage-inducible protein D n=1 Tax=Candidatus Nomurabacteria bacterium GW2011_GWF1_31_48 TaxID=1618767 RepID=A0A0F9YVA2_9BACT|nr:MAG: DNA-damage-inducible protein D [Candidatus Nomurabacteria bacterium GW2011_GWF2_30_133]KKP28823.1 MAG: DNA-damage-inducible protein D [Candidatus Nomurabacteria bacterium GW2011_GWE2_31_40]KKP30401.1 MAG: DNA-damage-inducible protein D [Candidatus Nomurabacteria bacterium GW2011_GWF1_31_48]KKP34928.1 MAG: DNA-damage-inducible protein D [Candidatus Nomurabacteria bacterium GW2011_GWE1_32_28]HAS81019.1 DNA damage-inducible protein D [Candidatus Nomurabacteria bacterium]